MKRIILSLLSLIWSCIAFAQDDDVLVVHSYHQGFYWTDSFQAGLDSVLSKEQVSTRVFYLDTKRLQTEEYFDDLYQLFYTKLRSEKFKAIVVSDNNALALMKRLAPQLGDIPVLFGGINNYSPVLHQGLNATGVIEDTDILSTLSLIQRVQPQLKRLWIVSDYSKTGEAVREHVSRFIKLNPSYRKLIHFLTPNNPEELIAKVSSMDKNQAVLYWVYFRDDQGSLVSDDDWQAINQQSKAPIYLVHDIGMGAGAVGGMMQSGLMQGQQVANKLMGVLDHPEQPMPKVEVGIPEIKFDYAAVRKWNLGIEGEAVSSFLNKPSSFTAKYQQELRVAGALVLLMLIVIMALVYYLSRLKKSELVAKQSQLLLEMVFDQSYHFIGILDAHGRVISSNSKLQWLFYHQDFRQDKPIWQHRHWEENAAQAVQRFFDSPECTQTTQFEAEIWHADEGAMVLEVTLKLLPELADNQAQYLFEARDITSRKVTEEKLYQREANLSHYYDKQPVMMVTLDGQNRIQQVNHFAEQLLGYVPSDILGHKLNEFYAHQDTLLPRQVLLQPKQALKGVWRRETEYQHANGETLWIRENIRPLAETGHLLIVGEDITEMKLLAQQLTYQAGHDLLTDTYNRNYFEIELHKALKEVEGYTRTHAMLFLDLDQLKVLNDTAGHEAGDTAIQFCASMLEDVLPYNAILARMGGDEFAILLRDCTERDAKEVARMIITTLSEQPFVWDEIRLNLTCSIGIRLIDHTAISPQMVHAQADTACHAAKEEGRNRFNLYCQDDEDLRQRQLEMESVNLVHHALANDRLELFAQRIINLNQDRSKNHFEILVRLKKADGEYISPAIFMPASERYNIAHLIDTQVVTKTLQWLESHPQAVEQLEMCSINLSGHSMGNQEFIAFLLETLDSSSVPCHKICLEITETAAMSNIKQAITLFSQLKALGCVIALDDFGSGLSSFGYLKQLPVDIVKIDGLFVRDMDVNEMDRVMVRSINDLAKQLGKKTVAEFVENTKIIDLLLELGVDYAQGYIIGKPKPLGDLVRNLHEEQKV
ncbi:EAL domain-containing protein [Vibrio sp. TRT 21S02]|uniref:EAL domain-containing protein n=1 Tax=Vibrio sp. TRT 21S02 TaxID=3418507 RepID=UPI003CE75726